MYQKHYGGQRVTKIRVYAKLLVLYSLLILLQKTVQVAKASIISVINSFISHIVSGVAKALEVTASSVINFTLSSISNATKLLAEVLSESTENTTCQTALYYGYNCEEHKTVTKDGYIIAMHRIPGSSCFNKSLAPVLLVHGLLGSSADWTLLGKGRALAYLLADSCRDVWMMNMRGNTYSRNHTYLNASQPEFWNWTYHEIGIYDNPAVIDYVLNKTNQSQVDYVGHSMGTTVFFVTCSMLKEYNDKIKTFVALAPVAFLVNTKSVIRILAERGEEVSTFLYLTGQFEFLPRNSVTRAVKLLCAVSSTLTKYCESWMFLIGGWDPDQITDDTLKIFLSHDPAGTSTKTMRHMAQAVRQDKFTQYDFGNAGNLIKYNSTTVPDYQLKNINVSIYLIYGLNDILSMPKDVYTLYSNLSTDKHLIPVNYTEYSHFDFIIARYARNFTYDTVIKILNK